MNSIRWQLIPTTVQTLKDKMGKHRELMNDVIKKADHDDKDSLQKCVDLNTDLNSISKGLYQQFCELRASYNQGGINLAKYRDYLKPIKDLLTERDQPIKNENLHLEEMVGELAKHF